MNDKIDVLAVMDRLLECVSVGVDADDPVRQLIEAGHEARAAIAGLIEATPALLALYRIKWGNLDQDANSVLDMFERALARVGGGK